MKTTNLLLLAFLLLAFSAGLSKAQNGGQRLSISQGDVLHGEFTATGGSVPANAAAAFTFRSLDGVPQTVPNQPCDGELNVNCGWYKAFWIFGDGNYYKFPDDPRNKDAGSLLIRNYDYGRAGTYQPVVYLTEKYHNDNPPEAARATINFTPAVASGNVTEMTRRLNNDLMRRLDIDYNHTPRVNYPINFVLSYKKNDLETAVLFFYNGLKGASGVSPAGLMNYVQSERPVYFEDNNQPSQVLNTSSGIDPQYSIYTDGTILLSLKSQYQNMLAYDVSSPNISYLDGLTELRVFPVMKINQASDMPNDRIPLAPASFLAVLLGSKPVEPSDTAYQNLFLRARTLINPDMPSSLALGGQTGLFIRDIQYLELPLQKSHDPNSLTVEHIYDRGNGKYRVVFRMVICNEGEMQESNPSLTFNDLTRGRFAGRPDFIGLNDVTVVYSITQPWKATLNRFNLSGSWSEGHPSCKEVFFDIITDIDGVQRLYQNDPRALEVCVDFEYGQGECNLNEPLKPGELQDADGKYLPDPDPVPTPNNWLLWFFLIILLALILWYWYQHRDE